MTLVRLTAPYVEIPNGGWRLGLGPDFYTALRDGSDSTWVIDDVATSARRMLYAYMEDYVVPANALIKSATPRLRIRQNANSPSAPGRIGCVVAALVPGGVSPQSPRTVFTPSFEVSDYYCAALPGSAFAVSTQARVNGLYVAVDTEAVTAAEDHLLYEVAVLLDVNYAPSVSGLALSPIDAFNRTSAPRITWTYGDPEGDPQAGYQVAIWKTSETADANWVGPTTPYTPAAGGAQRAPVLTAGAVGADVSCQTPGSLGLTNGTGYTVYVRVADAPLGALRYGSWTSYAFTQNVLAPPTPAGADFTAVWDPTHWRTAFTYQHRLNLLSTNQASVETDLTGWGVRTNATITRDTSLFLSGVASLKVTAVAGGTSGTQTPTGLSGFPVEPGLTYIGMAWARAGATSRLTTALLYWYDSAGALLGSSSGTGVADNSSSWTQITVTAVAPANAKYAALTLDTGTGTLANEVHRFEQMAVFPGAGTPPAWSRGGLAASATAVIERSGNGGTTWVPIPLVPLVPRAGAVLATYDTAAPPNQSVVYRLSTVSIDELGYSVRSAPSASSGAILPVFSTFVLRDPADPVGEVAIAPQGALVAERDERQGRFWPLGAEYETVVSDVVGSQRTHLRLLVRSKVTLDALKALRKKTTTLLLQFDTTEAWWCHLGEHEVKEHVLAASRRSPVNGSAANYFLDWDVIEVAAPAGLPQELV